MDIVKLDCRGLCCPEPLTILRNAVKAATDFPSLNVTAAWWDNSWHVTVGARPLRATLLQGAACGLVGEQPSEDELRALAASVRALSYGTNLWGSADYRRRISAPLAIHVFTLLYIAYDYLLATNSIVSRAITISSSVGTTTTFLPSR